MIRIAARYLLGITERLSSDMMTQSNDGLSTALMRITEIYHSTSDDLVELQEQDILALTKGLAQCKEKEISASVFAQIERLGQAVLGESYQLMQKGDDPLKSKAALAFLRSLLLKENLQLEALFKELQFFYQSFTPASRKIDEKSLREIIDFLPDCGIYFNSQERYDLRMAAKKYLNSKNEGEDDTVTVNEDDILVLLQCLTKEFVSEKQIHHVVALARSFIPEASYKFLLDRITDNNPMFLGLIKLVLLNTTNLEEIGKDFYEFYDYSNQYFNNATIEKLHHELGMRKFSFPIAQLKQFAEHVEMTLKLLEKYPVNSSSAPHLEMDFKACIFVAQNLSQKQASYIENMIFQYANSDFSEALLQLMIFDLASLKINETSLVEYLSAVFPDSRVDWVNSLHEKMTKASNPDPGIIREILVDHVMPHTKLFSRMIHDQSLPSIPYDPFKMRDPVNVDGHIYHTHLGEADTKQGSFAKIFVAKDSSTGDLVALKKTKNENEREGIQLEEGEELQRIKSELKISLQVYHPNIVKFLAGEVLGNELRLVMELFPKGDYMNSSRHLKPDCLIYLFYKLPIIFLRLYPIYIT